MSTTIPTFSLVIGVDEKHLRQLSLTYPTWRRFRPQILDWPMIVFFDHRQVQEQNVRAVVDHPNLRTVPWPFGDANSFSSLYGKEKTCKWDDPQRYRMLAGFVYVPSAYVYTDYWLKLDTDVVAVGQEDWIKMKWFKDSPSIVAHRWSFTKPADQMDRLDEWVSKLNGVSPTLESYKPLGLSPKPGASSVGHRRIISWCSFFETTFSRFVASVASYSCGPGLLPVPSQDGYVWYCAKRMERGIVRANMKSLGWKHCSNEKNIRKAIEETNCGRQDIGS